MPDALRAQRQQQHAERISRLDEEAQKLAERTREVIESDLIRQKDARIAQLEAQVSALADGLNKSRDAHKESLRQGVAKDRDVEVEREKMLAVQVLIDQVHAAPPKDEAEWRAKLDAAGLAERLQPPGRQVLPETLGELDALIGGEP